MNQPREERESSVSSEGASSPSPRTRFAFLNLLGHPRGNYILHEVVRRGFVPELVIEEDSSLAEKGRNAVTRDFFEELSTNAELCPDAPPFADSLCRRSIVRDNMNCDRTRELLVSHGPWDVILLGDCRILKSAIFEIPRLGTINIHPGHLPMLRGNTPYVWAIHETLRGHPTPEACTAHLVDEGIDTGPILWETHAPVASNTESRRRISGLLRHERSVDAFGSYGELLRWIHRCCGELAIRSLLLTQQSIAAGADRLPSITQAELDGFVPYPENRTLADPKIKREAKQWLRARRISP